MSHDAAFIMIFIGTLFICVVIGMRFEWSKKPWEK